MPVKKKKGGLYIVMISAHGLIRGEDLELGRDPDTGGQITYVIELVKALAQLPEVAQVDLLTRQVFDSKVSGDYSVERESLADNAGIVRLPFGPRRYLRKEVLWNYLDCFADNALKYIRNVERVPSVIHCHYADAGYVGVRLASLLDVPLFYTGHSLGRVKQERLLVKGSKQQTLENKYNISKRIEAEESVLSVATRVIASTKQEVEEQYATYDNYQTQRMVVIPPGTDIERFHPPPPRWRKPGICKQLDRFLTDSKKPMLLAISRADERKNIATLVKAYGESKSLRSMANLVIIAGNRDDITKMERGTRAVLNRLIMDIDKYDLYGSVAYPKHHSPDDIPELYRLACRTHGIFINPALTEPFGLTLIEAAASGLPIVATDDGGPNEIIANCKNGILIDPLDANAISDALLKILKSKPMWKQYSANGLKGVDRHYTWPGHAKKYLQVVKKITTRRKKIRKQTAQRQRLVFTDRVLISDADNTLFGDNESLTNLLKLLEQHHQKSGFGITSGRGLQEVLASLEEVTSQMPDVLIVSAGTEIYYGPNMILDQGWQQHIDYRWRPTEIRELVKQEVKGLRLQPDKQQRNFKLSYILTSKKAPDIHELMSLLRKHDLQSHIVCSHGKYLDFLPVHASKGSALRYFADKWNIPLERTLVIGGSASDLDMLKGRTLGVVVGNHHKELDDLEGLGLVYFARASNAQGILEAIEHYDFFGECRVPADVYENA